MKTFVRGNTLDKDKYLNDIEKLIEKSRKLDSTVIPHTIEELLYRYNKSLVCIYNKEVIWHLSIYPTNIVEIKNLNIWELWSVIIVPKYRWKWLWKIIVENWIREFSNIYDWVIWATINKAMSCLLEKTLFEKIPFPLSYYSEWKEFLSPLMKWWEEEFKKRAECFLLVNTPDIKQRILNVLSEKQN